MLHDPTEIGTDGGEALVRALFALYELSAAVQALAAGADGGQRRQIVAEMGDLQRALAGLVARPVPAPEEPVATDSVPRADDAGP